MSTPKNRDNVHLLTLSEIASWSVRNALKQNRDAEREKIVAVLPALQRGAVWKPYQIEGLWDSLVRSFPIGAFLLAPIDKERRGEAEMKLSDKNAVIDGTHHLLDGQQRQTAIALAYYDIWKSGEQKVDGPVLWVDLAPLPEKDDRTFACRVLTRSHPWGYQRKNSRQRLEMRQIRAALEAFRKASPEHENKTPGKLPLTHVWPWEATAPIPLALLVEAVISGGDVSEKLLGNLNEKLPFWSRETLQSRDVISRKEVDWKANVIDSLNGDNKELHDRFNDLVSKLKNLVSHNGCFHVPALIVPDTSANQKKIEDTEGTDPIETLFIRINSGGTPLEGEELIYSILKSAWIEAPKFIGELKHRLLSPPRLVVLVARLILANGTSEHKRPPAAQDPSRFRRLIYGFDKEYPTFHDELMGFVEGRAVQIFESAYELLTQEKPEDTHSYRLPPVLAAGLARGATGGDVIFLLLRWLDRMEQADRDPLTALDDSGRRRLLGTLTSIAWFSRDSGQCLTAIWGDLQKCPIDKLPEFFSRETFSKMLCLDSRRRIVLYPIVPPNVLESVIRDRIITPSADKYGNFEDPADEKYWGNKWSRWEWLQEDLTAGLQKWSDHSIRELWQAPTSSEEDSDQLDERYRAAWTDFLNRIWADRRRRLVLFAQREWMVRWFPDYDPTLPDQVEDMNRPWDYDHIHPQNYVAGRHNVPKVIRDWHNSIGNLRAWPLECNRSDSDTSPSKKFCELSNLERKRYGMENEQHEREASFVGADEWVDWEQSVPDDLAVRYLAYPDKYGEYRKTLVRAITTRFCRIYREWYETLMLGDLMP